MKCTTNAIVIDTEWGAFPISSRNSNNLVITHNLVFGINGMPDFDLDLEDIATNMFIADPLFINADSFDFSLNNGSPAIGVAQLTNAPSIDFFGSPRDDFPDIGAVEFISPISNNINSFEEKALKVYPNPFQNELFIEGHNLDQKTLCIYGVTGQCVDQRLLNQPGNSTVKVGSLSLSEGIYFLVIEGEAKSFTCLKK